MSTSAQTHRNAGQKRNCEQKANLEASNGFAACGGQDALHRAGHLVERGLLAIGSAASLPAAADHSHDVPAAWACRLAVSYELSP